MVRGICIAILCVCFADAVFVDSLQAQERPFSMILKGNFTTSSEIFPNPGSTDPIARSLSYAVDDFFGYGGELRYQFSGWNIAVGVSADYIKAGSSYTISLSPLQHVPVEDGYMVVPIEVTGYFIIPASGKTFSIYMGGGGGAYFGQRVYSLAGTEAAVTGTKPGFGIHVLGGISIHVTERFFFVGEMKFRDLQFESTNVFSMPEITYQGFTAPVSQAPFNSKIHIDGILFQLGAAFSF